MAMGKRKSEQAPLWIPTTELPVSPGFPGWPSAIQVASRLEPVATVQSLKLANELHLMGWCAFQGLLQDVDSFSRQEGCRCRDFLRGGYGRIQKRPNCLLAADSHAHPFQVASVFLDSLPVRLNED